MQEFIGFGQHLMIDGYFCDKNRISDLNLIYNFLDSVPQAIGMTKIMPPYVFAYNAKNKEDSGISGICLIAESHISGHFFEFKEYLSIDIFSCKPFDSNIAINFVKKTFDIKGKIEINQLQRGLEFPRNINLAKNIITRQRTEL